MKTKSLGKKLTLNKETVTNLREKQMDKIKGGLDSKAASCWETCLVRTNPCFSCPNVC